MTRTINDDTRITITNPDGDESTIHMALGPFFKDNEDGIGPEEQADIRAALAKGEAYLGGGGAAPGFTISLTKGFRAEFPDFDPASMPTIPDAFEDTSWHNDSCPSFRSEALGLELFVDYLDPALREFPEMEERFTLHHWDDGQGDLIVGASDWAKVEEAIRPHLLAQAFAEKLGEALTHAQWLEMEKRNRSEEYVRLNMCASHDFCDANEVMLEAFVAVLDREPEFLTDDNPSETDSDLWNEAWTLARTRYLTAKVAK